MAAATIAAEILKFYIGANNTRIRHLCDGFWAPDTCSGECDECRKASLAVVPAAGRAVALDDSVPEMVIVASDGFRYLYDRATIRKGPMMDGRRSLSSAAFGVSPSNSGD